MNTCCVYRRKISHLKLILRTAFLVILLLTIYLLHNSLHTTYNSPFSINNQAYLLNNYTYIVTKEELEFPLAFSLIIYRDYDRAYRLIQIIYRPHNFYCIHIDKKSSEIDYQKFRQLIFQFNKTNIYFIADAERVNVQWGRYSVLEADLKCAQLLLLSCCGKKKKANKWKYFINLTGHEFPLRTNWELVKALKLLNGLNIAPAHWLQTKPWRIPPKHLVPLNITWYEGPVHVALRREFVHYMLYNESALILLNSLKQHEKIMRQCIIPDEQYFSTLNNNPQTFHIPGNIYQKPFQSYNKYFVLTRVKLWWHYIEFCSTNIYRNGICILGSHDLPFLMKHPHFFANKFLPNIEPEAYDQLEYWILNKMLYEFEYHQIHPSFLTQYYMNYTLSQIGNFTFTSEFF